jgi:hypothetical protein
MAATCAALALVLRASTILQRSQSRYVTAENEGGQRGRGCGGVMCMVEVDVVLLDCASRKESRRRIIDPTVNAGQMPQTCLHPQYTSRVQGRNISFFG